LYSTLRGPPAAAQDITLFRIGTGERRHAVASNGSIDNIDSVASGSIQSGFVQSDVAYWAFNGSGIYEGRPKVVVYVPSPASILRAFTWWPARALASSRFRDLRGKARVA